MVHITKPFSYLHLSISKGFVSSKIYDKCTEAYKGHCVLCKDVLSFVFQTFDFHVLCFGFCVLCPVLLNGAMET